MSKERARRRAERELVAEAARRTRSRQVARRAVRRRMVDVIRRPALALRPRRKPDSALRRFRRRQDGALAAGLFALNGVLWLFDPSWLVRGGGLVMSVLAWPLLIIVIFDRGRSA
jgi:hypothetical protein